MGKRSVGVCVWLTFGVLVLVAMVPNTIWIGLGVFVAIAFFAYSAILQSAQKEKREAYWKEPTLAELIAKGEPHRSFRPAPESPLVRRSGHSSERRLNRQATIDGNREHAQALRDRSTPILPLVNEEISTPAHPVPPAAAAPRPPQESMLLGDTSSGSEATELHDQSAKWSATRQATIDAIRERAQTLREKFPPIPPRTNEQIGAPVESTDSPIALQPPTSDSRSNGQATINWNRDHAKALCGMSPPILPLENEEISAPAHPVPPATPPRPPQNSIPLKDTPSGSETAKLPDQSAKWNATRQATIDAIRKRVQTLREKFPPILLRTNEQIGGPLEPTASPIGLQPLTPYRVSERPITASSPPTPLSGLSVPELPAPNAERNLKDSVRLLQGSRQPEPMYLAREITQPPLIHALPAAPAGFGEGRWVAVGESIKIAGVNLPGGMLYVGGSLRGLDGAADPCLISGQYTVARLGNFRSCHLGYSPSYADADPEQRRAYLNWLSDGRSHPDCDIGYVFLFFYGLERRVIVDSRNDPVARDDFPAIKAELRRLLTIYGEKSGSFNRYASELLSWLELGGKTTQLYKEALPDFEKTYELPPHLRLALGQAAMDRAPLSSQLALAWLRLSPDCYLRTAAIRCHSEFERLFTQRYYEALGPGLVLPKNRTKLKFVYKAASAGLRRANITMTLGDIPDVTALTTPIKKLVEIANQCTDELGSYSRLVGKDPAAAEALEGLLLLPVSLWPTATQEKLGALTTQMRDGLLSLPLKELLTMLGGTTQVFNRDRARGLARALEGAEIGMEPHVLNGAKAPGQEDTIVLFAQPTVDSDTGSRVEYHLAALTLQLASAVAQADGEFHHREVAHLRSEIDGWVHLTLAERRRLHAHLQWLVTSPMNLSALKKKLEPLPLATRETLAGFMATLAQADGIVSPDEVRFLEKVYKTLAVEPKRVFNDIHTAFAGGPRASSVQSEKQGFRLDAERVAALQRDTARVSELLSKIFEEEAAVKPAPIAPVLELELEVKASAPLGLDEAHSALLRLLLSRAEWTRAELEDAAADLDLMLDGAMEQINEAAFETFDEALFEGEDPITVNTKLLEKIEA